MNDCEKLNQRKEKCYAKHGSRAEKCEKFRLQEKRCLSFRHCPAEATRYYGTLSDDKALCACFEESACFGNPRIMGIDTTKEKQSNVDTFQRHRKALSKVTKNKQLFRNCQDISNQLTKCLRPYL